MTEMCHGIHLVYAVGSLHHVNNNHRYCSYKYNKFILTCDAKHVTSDCVNVELAPGSITHETLYSTVNLAISLTGLIPQIVAITVSELQVLICKNRAFDGTIH